MRMTVVVLTHGYNTEGQKHGDSAQHLLKPSPHSNHGTVLDSLQRAFISHATLGPIQALNHELGLKLQQKSPVLHSYEHCAVEK